MYETLSPYSTVIHAETILDAYPLLIEAILSAGNEVYDERGSRTKELLNVQVTIYNPVKNPIPENYRPESWIKNNGIVEEYMEKYAETYLAPNVVVGFDGESCYLKKDELAYTYGTRLRKY